MTSDSRARDSSPVILRPARAILNCRSDSRAGNCHRIRVEKSQWPASRFPRVVHSDSRGNDEPRTAAAVSVNADVTASEEVGPAVGDGDAQSSAQLAWAGQQFRRAGRRLGRPQEDGLRVFGPARHHVGAAVHAIYEKHIEMTPVEVHGLDTRRSAAFPGVGGRVARPQVCLGFDDSGAVPAPAPSAGDPGADQIPRYGDGLPVEKLALGLNESQALRIKPQTMMRSHSREDKSKVEARRGARSLREVTERRRRAPREPERA